MYQQSQYFAAARYQVGPRWSLYGGVLDTNFTVENAATSFNDFRRKAVDMGAVLETSRDDSFGVDYRYTDARYPNAIVVSNSSLNPDYREDRLRFLAKAVLTEKTTMDLMAGVLKRNYGSSVIGSFSGPIWRGALGWQPTQKTQLIVAVWRDLQAYLTDTTNYYRTTAESIAPTWTPSEKIALSIDRYPRRSEIHRLRAPPRRIARPARHLQLAGGEPRVHAHSRTDLRLFIRS